MSYTTTGAIRQALGLGDTPEYDYLLAQYAAQATAMIEAKTGKVFQATTDTSRTLNAIDDVDGGTLYLRRSLASLAASNAVTNGNGDAVPPSEYVLWPTDGPPYTRLILKLSSAVDWTYITTPEHAITVSGKWADTASVPPDIALAATTLAAWLYQTKDQPMQDTDRVQVSPTGQVMMPPNWPPKAREIIAEYVPRAGAGSRVVRGVLVR